MFLQQLINGFLIGGIYSLVTIGFNMVFGVLGITNFAHSSFYMLAAYFVQYLLVGILVNVSPVLALIVSIICSVLTVGCLGMLMNKYTIQIIQKKRTDMTAMILSTIGIQTIINNIIILLFGSAPRQFPNPLQDRTFQLGENVVLREIQVYIVVITLLLMIGLSFFVTKTKIGKAIRGVSQDPVAAKLMGINVNRVIQVTFFIGTLLAGVAGIITALYYQRIDPNMANAVSLKSFAAAVLGGLGSVPGAFLGGYIIGIVETFFAAYIDAGYRDVVAFIILIVVLMIRPNGLLGKKEIDKV